jgi:hypothetical protein
MLVSKSYALAQPVTRHPVIAEARVQSQVSLCEMCDGQSGISMGFSQSCSVLTSQYHATDAQSVYLPLFTRCSHQDKWAKPGNIQEAALFRGLGSIGWKSTAIVSSLTCALQGDVLASVYGCLQAVRTKLATKHKVRAR